MAKEVIIIYIGMTIILALPVESEVRSRSDCYNNRLKKWRRYHGVMTIYSDE